MCGICGFSGPGDKGLLEKMTSTLRHRGPDQSGFYFDRDICLGHRRLSIIDLSERGKQPLTNEDGTIQLVCNGEIYNYRLLTRELRKRGHRFHSHSDNEVIIHAYEEYGLDCLRRFRGMFAFGLWDNKQKRLLLARDRIGIKPLYYMIQGSRLLFASEIKALLCDPTIERKVDQYAYLEYLTFQYVPSNKTMFENVHKVPPGHLLIFQDGKLRLCKYWNLGDLLIRAQREPHYVVVSTIREMLKESVKIHLMSDVPLGILLSGGLDSSSLVGIASKYSQSPVKTFSVGFGQSDDELPFARKVAEHFGTDHHEFIFGPQDLIEALDKVVYHCDEPIADGGLLATYWVAEYVKQHVTVVLVGEGSDELFGGYPWHKLSAPCLSFLPQSLKREIFSYLISYYRGEGLTGVVRKAWKNMKRSHMQDLAFLDTEDFLRQLQAFEFEKQLPNHLLMKVDKMTMAHSVEARVPFLDHPLVEYALPLSSRSKIHGLKGKYILRQAVRSFLPKEVVCRKKHGLVLPISKWLRCDLKSMALDLLTSVHGHARQNFEKYQIEKLFKPTKNKLIAIEQTALLWRLLIFEIWHQEYILRL